MKRDSTRVVRALQRALHEMPHLRVGQIIENARLTGNLTDLFYVTDEQLAKSLDVYRERSK